MTTLEAHNLFCARQDRSVWPDPIDADGIDVWPAAMTAAVVLAGDGWLDQCTSDAGLDEAVKHFNMLIGGDVVTDEQWEQETLRVLGEFMQRGDELCRMMGGVDAVN